MKKQSILLLTIIILASCSNSNKAPKNIDAKFPSLRKKAIDLFGKLPNIADNKENPVTDAKVALGKRLYFDKILSKDNTQSCNTCHNLNTYGVDNNPFSKGNDGELGGRNSPTTLNAALHIAQFWDGREPDVEAQAGGPILNPVEMAMPSKAVVVARLDADESYFDMFDAAFPGADEAITYDKLQKAIGAFERRLITPSKFDKYLTGDNNALTDKEKEGLQTFIKIGCTNCHNGVAIGGNSFRKFGEMQGDYWKYTKSKKIDNGKFDITGNESDKYVFKVAGLRNVSKTYPYFHDGSVDNLEDAVKIMAKTQLNKELTKTELEQIVAFLNSLTGEIAGDLKAR